MRIISGYHKGRRITAPSQLSVRPTTDAGKECLFNILANHFSFSAISFLDLFAGSGNISYEASSRGCTDITAVDQEYKCTGFIKSTASDLKMEGFKVVRSDAFRYLQDLNRSFDIIFADPPYVSLDTANVHRIVFERKLLNVGGFLIIEHGNNEKFDHLPHLKDKREIGNVNFTIFNP